MTTERKNDETRKAIVLMRSMLKIKKVMGTSADSVMGTSTADSVMETVAERGGSFFESM